MSRLITNLDINPHATSMRYQWGGMKVRDEATGKVRYGNTTGNSWVGGVSGDAYPEGSRYVCIYKIECEDGTMGAGYRYTADYQQTVVGDIVINTGRITAVGLHDCIIKNTTVLLLASAVYSEEDWLVVKDMWVRGIIPYPWTAPPQDGTQGTVYMPILTP